MTGATGLPAGHDDHEAIKKPAQLAPIKPSHGVSAERSAAEDEWWTSFAPALVVVYVCGVLFMLARLCISVWRAGRLRKESIPVSDGFLLEIVRKYVDRWKLRCLPMIARCGGIAAPVVVGILRPVILIPAVWETGMSPQQWEAVLIHELAHIRRFDLLVNLLQRFAEAMLFYHPVLWYVSRRISAERENICDDLVLATGCQAWDYADALLRVAEACAASRGQLANRACLSATGSSPSELKQRILRLIGAPAVDTLQITRAGLAALVAPWVVLISAIFVMPAGPAQKLKSAKAEERPPVKSTIKSAQPANDSEPETRAKSKSAARPEHIRDRRVSLSVKEMPFKLALEQVCREAKVELDFNGKDLREGFSVDDPVTVDVKDVTLDEAIRRILGSLYTRQRKLTGILSLGVWFAYEGNKVLVDAMHRLDERWDKFLPQWLRALQRHGLIAAVDDDHNVGSVTIGQIANDELFKNLATLPKLQYLHVGSMKGLTPAGLSHLAKLQKLDHLEFHGSSSDESLGDEILRVVSRIKSLRELTVSECAVTDEGVKHLESMTQLVKLSIRSCFLTDAGLKSLSGLKNLRSLTLSGPKWNYTGITDEGLTQLARLSELEELHLAGLAVSGKQLNFPRLTALSLSGNNVDDNSAKNIAKLRQLRDLTLAVTLVTDEGLKHLSELSELRKLNLNSGLFTDAGIAHLKNLRHLENLGLRATQIGDAALGHLAEIKSLTRLNLNGSGSSGVTSQGRLFTETGLQKLKALPRLDTLWIDNLILGDWVSALGEVKQLRSLVLGFCGISREQAEKLEEALPDAYVQAVSGSDIIPRRKKRVSPAPATKAPAVQAPVPESEAPVPKSIKKSDE